MSKKATTLPNDENRKELGSIKYDVETIHAVALKVKAEGFVPASVLQQEFGPAKTTQAIAVLYRDFRLFREVRRPWEGGTNVLGYEWANEYISQAKAKKVPQEFGFVVELARSATVKYADFQSVKVRCRYTNAILGSVPVKDANGDPTNVFERDSKGNVLLLRYHQRAMASQTLPVMGKEAAMARRILFDTIRIPNATIDIVEHGIVEQGRAGGKGLRRSERIKDGTEFNIEAQVPTSVLSIAEFIQMLRIAGQHVGLSPGRSAGFGDFEVVEAA